MAVYRKVSISFWTDPKVDEQFSPEDKYFFLYLLTNPHTNLCGCYEISHKQISNETGYSTDSVTALLDRFERVYNKIRYDKNTAEMLVLNWKKYNWSSSPKFTSSVEKEISKVKNAQFREFLMSDDTVSILYPYSMDTVPIAPVTVTDTVNSYSSNSNNDINLENVNTEKEVKKRARKNYEDTEEFTAFWDAYPKHQGKATARTAFEKVDVPLQVLLDAIEEQKKSRQWTKDGGDFIPMPTTWLNQRRWEDSMNVNMQGKDRYANLRKLAEEFGDE